MAARRSIDSASPPIEVAHNAESQICRHPVSPHNCDERSIVRGAVRVLPDGSGLAALTTSPCDEPVPKKRHARRGGGRPSPPPGPHLLAHRGGAGSRVGGGIPPQRRGVRDRRRAVKGRARLRLRPVHRRTGRRGLPRRAPRRHAGPCPGRSTGPRGVGRRTHPRRPCPRACGRQTVPTVVEGGRRTQGTQDLAGRCRGVLRVQPDQRIAASGVRAAGLRLALLLEHARVASRSHVP